jgi:hypothetical protein
MLAVDQMPHSLRAAADNKDNNSGEYLLKRRTVNIPHGGIPTASAPKT